jgi:hypothetical protein
MSNDENCRVLLISYLCDLSSKPMWKFVTECCYCPVLLSTEINTKVRLEMEVNFFISSFNLRTQVQIVAEATEM